MCLVQVDRKALPTAVTPGTSLTEAQLSARALSVSVAEEEAGETSPAGKCFQLEMTRILSAHISLMKASQMVTSNFQGAESTALLQAAGEGTCVSDQQ